MHEKELAAVFRRCRLLVALVAALCLAVFIAPAGASAHAATSTSATTVVSHSTGLMRGATGIGAPSANYCAIAFGPFGTGYCTIFPGHVEVS